MNAKKEEDRDKKLVYCSYINIHVYSRGDVEQRNLRMKKKKLNWPKKTALPARELSSQKKRKRKQKERTEKGKQEKGRKG